MEEGMAGTGQCMVRIADGILKVRKILHCTW
jgi:hypothetical protein